MENGQVFDRFFFLSLDLFLPMLFRRSKNSIISKLNKCFRYYKQIKPFRTEHRKRWPHKKKFFVRNNRLLLFDRYIDSCIPLNKNMAKNNLNIDLDLRETKKQS